MYQDLPANARIGWVGTARWAYFANREDKAVYMQRGAERDARDPMVRVWAEHFLRLPAADVAPALLRFVQFSIRYTNDPATYDRGFRGGERHGIEVLDSSAVGLQRGYGDCDLKARLFVALCLACAIRAAIQPIFRGPVAFPHVRAALFDPRSGEWLIADPCILNSTLGCIPRHPIVRLDQLDAEGWRS